MGHLDGPAGYAAAAAANREAADRVSVNIRQVVDALAERYEGAKVDKVVGIESRGFIVGAAVAYKLGVGFVPVRKKGKLPGDVLGHDYALEYGTDRVEIHSDAISANENILLLDDLIATGGTAEAAAVLIEKLGGQVLECAFIVGLPDLGGQQRLQDTGQGDGHRQLLEAGRGGGFGRSWATFAGFFRGVTPSTAAWKAAISSGVGWWRLLIGA